MGNSSYGFESRISYYDKERRMNKRDFKPRTLAQAIRDFRDKFLETTRASVPPPPKKKEEPEETKPLKITQDPCSSE